MRLEYKVGVVVAVAVVGLGTWFFITRDRASDTSVVRAPDVTKPDAAKPATAARQASPRPVPTANRPTPAPAFPRPVVRPDSSRMPTAVTTRPAQPTTPSFSLNPDRSTSPGIRSETPVMKPESPIERPMAVTEKPAADMNSATIVSGTRLMPQPSVPKPSIGALAPSGSTPAPTAPAPDATPAKTHVMKSGDTIQGLAIKYYGAAKYASLIFDANKQLGDPRRIPVGAKITIPPAPATVSDASKTAAPSGNATPPSSDVRTASAEPRRQPPNTKPYVVRKGDNWQRIAGEVMGDRTRWTELFELNKRSANETPHALRAGDTIYVPAETTTSPPSRTLMSTTPKS